jgi:hypothetical protein
MPYTLIRDPNFTGIVPGTPTSLESIYDAVPPQSDPLEATFGEIFIAYVGLIPAPGVIVSGAPIQVPSGGVLVDAYVGIIFNSRPDLVSFSASNAFGDILVTVPDAQHTNLGELRIITGYPDNGRLFSTNDIVNSTVSATTLQIDAADKSEAATLQLAENSTGTITSAPQSGTVHFTDTDTATRPMGSVVPGSQTVSVTDASGKDITNKLTANQISALKADFTIAAAPGNTNNGAINWTYNPQGTALNFLLEGQTAVITSTVQVSDQDGNSDTATVGVTLKGAPDKLHFDVFLGSGGYGTIKAFNNGQPLALSSTGSNQANVAFDDLMPVPDGTYNVLFRDSPKFGRVLAFSFSDGTSEFPDRDAIEIHGGNTPGDSAGCIVTGDLPVNGLPTNNYWTGLRNVLSSIAQAENASQNGLGYYTLQNPITVTVSGDTDQPTLLCIPETTVLTKGSSEVLDFQVAGLAPSSPIVDKDINVYFQVLGTTATASLIPDAQFEALWPSPTGVLYHNVFTKIIHGSNQQTPKGNNDFKVTLNTSGVASKSLTIQIVGYDGITYLTNLSTDAYAPPGGSIHVQPLLDQTIPVPITLFSSKAPGTTADAIMRDGATGNYEIYNIGNNAILAGYPLGQVGTNWQFVGLGGFNNTNAGQVGNAALSGFANTTDMVLRDSNSGAFEVYNISDNNIINAASLGAVGLNWQFGGFGDFSSRPGETDMILRNSANGALEVYDIANNALVSAYSMGAVGLDWQIAGFGDFSSNPNETDMIMRNVNTGALEVYDIASNALMSAYSMGAVGLDWQVAGFGNFSSRPNETDMIMRNSNTGALEVYNIANNSLMSAYSMGAVGLDWQVVGFGNFSGNANETDMIMRNSSTGALEVYDIANNALTAAYSAGAVGLNWEVGGIAPDAASASTASMGDSSQVASLVQAMAGFDGSGAGDTLNSTPLGADTSQQAFLMAPQHA